MAVYSSERTKVHVEGDERLGFGGKTMQKFLICRFMGVYKEGGVMTDY